MPEPENILEKRLRKDLRHFTLYEAAASTGLSIDAVRDGMQPLMEKYLCRLQVTENGDLIYDCGEKLRRRGRKSLRDIWRLLSAKAWQIFTGLFKIWITMTLVVYFLIFVAIMILLLVAASSQRSDRRGGGGGRGGGMPINMNALIYTFMSIFRWRTHSGRIRYDTDRQGYPYRRYESPSSAINEKKKSFIASVYDFVFGPPRVQPDTLQNAREVAAFLTENKGILVTADLEALAGWNASEADTYFTECLVRFQGEVNVSEQGAIYGEFDDILRGIGEAGRGKIVYYWDEYEPEYEVTGNSTGRNIAVGFMNVFNLFFALLITSGAFSGMVAAAQQNPEMRGPLIDLLNSTTFLGWVPLVFSLLFFAIPLGRWMKVQFLRRQRRANNIRKRLYKVIFTTRGQPQTLDAVVTRVNQAGPEEKLAPDFVQKWMNELSLDLQGDLSVDEEGKLRYEFPKIRLELEDAPRLRAQKKITPGLGDVIVESD